MQTLWTVVVLLALVALGALFIARVNAQGAGRMAPHRYADWKQSLRGRKHKPPHDHDDAHPGAPTAGAPTAGPPTAGPPAAGPPVAGPPTAAPPTPPDKAGGDP
ncbi:hypothetical protein RM550_08270 [Streptomyces sp. DSM 41527]|uniref:Uncharacterized protein n=1 Tax=Streptomyces mooreae TaxID=3075523 RepID=A0ABU2T416_9ACTN|nr:hypothetical protein [Streptomyces sp. DSM 41527]MDT0455733.1 hypothetical protein [Streptomyces sp. DSM 41527]